MLSLLRKWLYRFRRQPSIYLRDRPEFEAFQIGDGTYGFPDVISFGDKGLSIGRYCSIARDVLFLLRAEHHLDWVTTYPFPHLWDEAAPFTDHPIKKGNIVVGNDVWIGQRATILSGVQIGDGAVIAAASVVTRDVPPYAIVGGNPARLIRHRFSPEQVASLQKIAWWSWGHDKIVDALPLLLAPDIDRFISAYSSADNSTHTTRQTKQ